MKLIAFLLILLLVVGGFVVAAKDAIAKLAFVSAVEGLTGFDTTVGSLHFDFAKALIHLEGLTLLNPPQYEKRVFAEVPEIYFQMDLPALLRKERVHIQELRLSVQELNIEKTPQGVSNISLLTSVKKSQKKTAAAPPPSAKKKGLPFRLDRLELTMRRVSYNDRSSLVPKKIGLDVHVQNQVFEGIEDPKSIVNIILMKVMRIAPLENLGVNPAEIQNQLKSSVQTLGDLGGRVLTEGGAQLTEKGEVVGSTIYETGKETAAQVGSAAKEEIGNLFGKLRSKITS